MRSQTKNLVFLLFLALFVGLKVPGALADSQVIKPIANYPGNMAYATGTGQYYEGLLFMPVVDSYPTVSGIMFHGLNASQDALVNNATLALNFALDPVPGEAHLSVYGVKSAFPNNDGFFGASDLLEAQVTAAHVNLNLSGQGEGWLEVDVTNIVQEIVNREHWEALDNLGLVFLNSGGPPFTPYKERAITANLWLPAQFPQINVTWGEAPPGFENETVTQFEGYTIVPILGNERLINTTYWVPAPVTIVGAAVNNVDANTYNSTYVEDGPFGEIWGNETFEGNMYGNMPHAVMQTSTITVSYCGSPVGSFGDYSFVVERPNNTKVIKWTLERTWGAAVGGSTTMGYVALIAEPFSGSWTNRNSNSKITVGLSVRTESDTEVSIGVASIATSASANDITVGNLTEGNTYLIKYGIQASGQFWLGDKYQWVYISDIYHLNETTGEITDMGRANKFFNASTALMDKLTVWELFESRGSGLKDAWFESYIARGWIPIGNYDNSWNVTTPPDFDPPDPDCLAAATTVEEVIACIIDVLPGGVAPSDDPAPPGWEEEGVISRPRIVLYYLILGISLIIAPVAYLAMSRNFENLYLVLFLVFMGVSLLIASRYV